MAKIKVPGAKGPTEKKLTEVANAIVEQIEKEAATPPVPVKKGMVLYTDGGCKPSRGHGGWGLHGYYYSATPPKKGSGNPDVILTEDGYITKQNAAAFAEQEDPYPQVTPIHYVDGWGAFGDVEVTNNIAELTSTLRALQYAFEYELDHVQVLTDSKYTQENIEQNVDNWARRNWILSTGEPVKNREYWEALVEARDRLVNRGTIVRFNWVKGHNDNLGNEIADQYASYGVILSKKGIQTSSVETKTADGYWKYDTDRHPMLTHVCCYFNTVATYNDPGFYYLGTRSKDDELFGKRVSDGAFSVVSLKEPDPVMELVRNFQIREANGMDSLVCMRLDQLFKSSTHKQLMAWGENILRRAKPYKLDLNGMSDLEPLTREYKPPRLAERAVEAVSFLADTLDRYVAGDDQLIVTDITSILYETTLKTKKVKGEGEVTETLQTLRPEYGVGFASMEVEVGFGTPNETRTAKVTLTLGIDLLDRNALNKLASLKPQVKVVSWLESPTAFRYATVVEAGDDKGIWAGVYSNLRIVS